MVASGSWSCVYSIIESAARTAEGRSREANLMVECVKLTKQTKIVFQSPYTVRIFFVYQNSRPVVAAITFLLITTMHNLNNGYTVHAKRFKDYSFRRQ